MKVLINLFTLLCFSPAFCIASQDTIKEGKPSHFRQAFVSSDQITQPSGTEEEQMLNLYREKAWPGELNDFLISWQNLGSLIRNWEYELERIESHLAELDKWYSSIEDLEMDMNFYRSGLAVANEKLEALQSLGPNVDHADSSVIAQLNFWRSERNYLQTQLDALSRDETIYRQSIDRRSTLSKSISHGLEIYSQMELAIHDRVQTDSRSHAMRLNLGYVFGILVTVLIMAFFYIADKHHHIATAIFAGPSGIQFITLFLLVMALAIFGLTQILGGKELAALLGSISGYILGRGLSKGSGPQGSVAGDYESPENS